MMDKIATNKEFIDMADILEEPVHPEFPFNLMSQYNKPKKRKKYLSIEDWTDAFNIYSSALRKIFHHVVGLAEDLAIYVHLIRTICKDGGNWYYYDTTFRRTKLTDDTLPWSQVDQILFSRCLIKKSSQSNHDTPKVNNSRSTFQNQPFRKICYIYNEGKICPGDCGYPHLCQTCYRKHPQIYCYKLRKQTAYRQTTPPVTSQKPTPQQTTKPTPSKPLPK